jgi:hypothetical protein
MKSVTPSPLLKLGITIDAVASAASAVLQLAALGLLTEWLVLPRALLLETGVFMIGYAALLVWMARSARVPVLLTRFIVLGNLAWALACVGILVGGVVSPSPLGVFYVGTQAVAVAAFALMQAIGLKASAPVAAPALARSS